MSSNSNSVVPLWEEGTSTDVVPVATDELAQVDVANDTIEAVAVEPKSPSRLFKSLRWVAFLALIVSYPLSVLASHQVKDSPIVLEEGKWSSDDVGTVSELISREVFSVGWADDRAIWHPQARLTALPAWQEGLIGASAPWVQAVSVSTDNDSDLLAASRLLTPTAERPTQPRLNAALEALERYDSRLEGGFASDVSAQPYILTSLDQSIVQADDARALLGSVVDDTTVWPATSDAVRAYYQAKASAYVTHMRFEIMASDLESLQVSNAEDLKAQFQTATSRWKKAARQKPLFVMNQTGDGILSANHLAVMSFYIEDARLATEAFKVALTEALATDAASTQAADLASAP